MAAAGGALLGAQVGHVIGRRAGSALQAHTQRPRVLAAMERSRHLFARYGYGRAIGLARFVPVVRTVLDPVAGAVGTPVRVFRLSQGVGGLGWTLGVVLAGFVLGATVPGVDRYLLPVVAAVVVLSLVPLAIEALRGRRAAGRGTPAQTRGMGSTGSVYPLSHRGAPRRAVRGARGRRGPRAR